MMMMMMMMMSNAAANLFICPVLSSFRRSNERSVQLSQEIQK